VRSPDTFTPVEKRFAQAFKLARTELGLPRREMASLLGYPGESSIRGIETMNAMPSAEKTILAIAYLEFDVSEIVGDDG